MSKRRGPRERERGRGRGRGRGRENTNNRSQRVLQVTLIAAGILFLLVGAIITAGGGGLDFFGAAQSNDDSEQSSPPSGEDQSQSTPTPTPTSTKTVTETQERTTATPTATPTQTPTQTQTKTTTAAETPPTTRTATSGGLQITDKKDENENGYASAFSTKITADTRLKDTDPTGNGEPYFIVKINNEVVGKTNEVKRTANGVFTIDLEESTLEQYNRGQLQVTVELADKDPATDETITSWTRTVNYEPE